MSASIPIDPDCRFVPGVMVPVISPERCEAQGPCVAACPYGVLAIRIVPQDVKDSLPMLARVKLFLRGGKQAFAIDADACRGCGLCVQICPEKAIKLQRRPTNSHYGAA